MVISRTMLSQFSVVFFLAIHVEPSHTFTFVNFVAIHQLRIQEESTEHLSHWREFRPHPILNYRSPNTTAYVLYH